MKAAPVTGSAGLIGAHAVRRLLVEGSREIGLDNNMRQYFFGEEVSKESERQALKRLRNYEHEGHTLKQTLWEIHEACRRRVA